MNSDLFTIFMELQGLNIWSFDPSPPRLDILVFEQQDFMSYAVPRDTDIYAVYI